MKIFSGLLAGIISLSSSVVMAHGFHVDEKEIAATLAAPAELSGTYRDDISQLRADSERLHRIGKHHEAEAATSQAVKLEQKK